jgi:UDPglucose 6-dehydrogenase
MALADPVPKVMSRGTVQTISVIGLGKLGASMAAGFASRGYKVVGVDINPKSVEALNQGLPPVQETGLAEMIHDHRDSIRGTLSTEEAVMESHISFVIIPTPSDARGAFSLTYAKSAFREIGRALRKKKDYHTVVLTSTVLPGATRLGLLPILEKESGKKCGPDFGLCYNPEFIALGSVIRDFLNPDFYLLGQFDERSGDALEAAHKQVSVNQAPVKRMSLENAELAKISVNSFVTMKISFANMLAEFCERMPGGDVDVVSDALGLDKRIGRKYLTGGLGFGGPCFPRDNVALNFLGEALGVDSHLLKENDSYNRRLAEAMVKKIAPHIPHKSSVGILGLAYKPLSHVIEESPGVLICKALADGGYRVIAHDPLAVGSARGTLEYRVVLTENLQEVLKESEALIVTTPDPLYRDLFRQGTVPPNLKILIDPWRILGETAKERGIRHLPFGKELPGNSSLNILQNLWQE